MGLKAILENLEGVDPTLQTLYTQREDGKYVLGVDDAEEAFASGLAANRDQILKEKKELETKLASLKDVDHEEYMRLKQESLDAQRKRDEEAGNWASLKQQLIDGHSAEVTKKEQRISHLQNALHRELVESKAAQAISKAKGVQELLLPHVVRSIKVVEGEDGSFTTQVIDPRSGAPRIGDHRQGTPMTIEQLVEEMRANEIFGRAFDAVGAGGGGATGSQPGAGGGGFRLTAEQAKDPNVYRQMRDRAEKAGQTVTIVD